jgi:hypothetical protein
MADEEGAHLVLVDIDARGWGYSIADRYFRWNGLSSQMSPK